MKRPLITQLVLTVAMALLPAVSVFAVEIYFNDSAKVNIMRQFNPIPHTQMAGYSKINSSVSGESPNFSYVWTGDPWKPAQRNGGSYLTALNTATTEITLPKTNTIGSFRVQFSPSYQNIYPALWQLDGWNSADGWFTLHTGSPASYNYAGTFTTPKSVSKVRYTSTGPTSTGSGQYNYTFQNLNLYLSAGQSVPLYGAGYSLIHDTSRVTGSNTSPNNATWGPQNVNGFSAINGNYESYDLKAQTEGKRAYMTWNFDQPYLMDFAMLAGVYDYSISNWEVYTSNSLNTAALNALASATPADIQGLGWTLQYQQVGSGGGEKVFDFLRPGAWQYLMLVQNGQQPAWGQLEVYYSLPEPASLAFLALGGLALLRRRRG